MVFGGHAKPTLRSFQGLVFGGSEKPTLRNKLIVCLYKPPKASAEGFTSEIDKILENIDTNKHDVWIGGDFNLNFAKGADNRIIHVEAIMKSHNMTALIDKCTRPKEDKLSIIDNIITNAKNIIYSNVLPWLLSDHLPIVAVQKKPRNQCVTQVFTGRSYRRYNVDDLQEKLLYQMLVVAS